MVPLRFGVSPILLGMFASGLLESPEPGVFGALPFGIALLEVDPIPGMLVLPGVAIVALLLGLEALVIEPGEVEVAPFVVGAVALTPSLRVLPMLGLVVLLCA